MTMFYFTSLITLSTISSAIFPSNPDEQSAKDSLLDPAKYVKIYSSCDSQNIIHKNNGLYYIKPSFNSVIIPVICSNGYTMIDGSLDYNLKSLPSYLSSHDYSRNSKDYIIPNLDDTSTFRQWFLPSNKYTKFRIAKYCNSCEQSFDYKLTDNVVYYTDSSLFCYTWFNIQGTNPCSEYINEYACNKCDIGTFDTNNQYWTQCKALQMSSDTIVLHEPQMRVSNNYLIYKPVISMIRDSCTCYQQQNGNSNKPLIPEYFNVKITSLPKVTIGANSIIHSVDYIDDHIIFDKYENNLHINSENNEENLKYMDNCNNNKIYLTQEDFKYGTYRIRECGEYIFTQDIICDFNGPTQDEELHSNFSPNRIDSNELYWFPTIEQANKDNDYPGLYDFIGSYALGFFAGITIECNNVIINLNGFSFLMNKKFYLQQRFFSLIELASKQFEPLEGPSDWGWKNEFYASYVEIKGPGVLGLTSHHGIHGNNAHNINIHDINIKSFDVSGISCNGCTYLTIENVIVGPQNIHIPTLGRYTHARAFLPRLKHLNDKFGDKYIKFYGRSEIQISDLCKRMVLQMDMIYFNIINGIQYDENNIEWIAANKLFINPTGLMDGGSSYGITINGQGAAVVGIGYRHDETNNINIKNVEIFGIYNNAIEKIKYGLTRGILFDSIDWIAVTDQIENRINSQYIGDCYTDILFAASKFIDSWYYRNSYFISKPEIAYVFKGNTFENSYPFLKIMDSISCGTDIQLQSSKGAIGLMINGAKNSIFDNIYVHDVYNYAQLGSMICGSYKQIDINNEDIDIQFGYTATRAHGIIIDYTQAYLNNINITNIQSYNGEANGFTIYKESDVKLKDIVVNNINAGTQLNNDNVKELVLPNLIPRACGIDIHEYTNIEYLDSNNILLDNINGFIVCDTMNVFANSNDNKTINVLTVVFGLILMILFMIIIFAVYKLIKHLFYNIPNGNVKVSEQTPLLGI